jgi:hypothetical protein
MPALSSVAPESVPMEKDLFALPLAASQRKFFSKPAARWHIATTALSIAISPRPLTQSVAEPTRTPMGFRMP